MVFRGTWISNPTPWPRPDETWVWSYNQNLIGKDKLPNRSTDRPNPGIPAPIDQTWIQRHVQFTGLDKLPFNQKDWPNPVPPFRMEQTWLVDHTPFLGKDSFYGKGNVPEYDYPNPQPVQWYRDWSQSFALTHQVVQRPLNQYDWPNQGQPYQRLDQTWLQSYGLTGQDKLPNRQQDWPNPSPVQWSLGWTQNLAINSPVTSYVSRNPLFSNTRILDTGYRDWSETGNALAIPGVPTNQTDWPNPNPITWYQDWNNTLVLNMPVFMPSVVTNWDVPPVVTWYQDWSVNLLQGTLFAPPAPLPNNQYDWVNPTQPYRLDQTWIWNQTRYQGQDRLPNRQQYWPNPYPVQWYLPSNLGTLPFLFPIPPPLPKNQYDWPNPRDYLRQIDQNNYTYTSPFMPPAVIPVVTGGGIFPENFWKRMLDLDREQKSKHEAAVELGRLGGHARAKILTPHQRATLASNAAKARWK